MSQRRRTLAFEALDPRIVLSASTAAPAADDADTETHLSVPRAALSGTLAVDLVEFAKAVADSGTRFFGASWCPHCTDQKELFEDGAQFLPFIEVTNLDSPVTLNEVGAGTNTDLNPSGDPVGSFPTWEFPDGSRLTGTQSLQTLSERSGVPIPTSAGPYIAPVKLVDSDIDKDNIRDDLDDDYFNDGIPNDQDTDFDNDGTPDSTDGDIDGDGTPNVNDGFNDKLIVPRSYDADGDEILTVLKGSPLHVSFDGYDPNGDPLTYTISSSDPSLVSAVLLEGNRSMSIAVAGWGTMTFHMFEQRAPIPTSRLIELAQTGFYENVVFHRIVNGFVIQGGDPTGTGGGGSTLGDIVDQLHEELQHNRNGMLSYAKSSDDTNDSQFFVTEGATRHLDGNHSIAGVIVEGDKNREAISNNSTSNPRSVVIASAEVFMDTENAVAMLTAAPGASGSAEITVTATDIDGNQFSRTFTVNIGTDTSDTYPWLDQFGDMSVEAETTTNIQLEAIDIEGDDIRFGVVSPTNFTIDVPADPITPNSPAVADISITPNPGFTGSEEVTFFVLDAGTNVDGVIFSLPLLENNSRLFDYQTITLTSAVNDAPTVSLSDTTTSLAADANSNGRIKVADIVIIDVDGIGDNQLSLSGSDAGLFEIDGTELFVSASASLDSIANPTLNVNIVVNDPSVGSTPDDTVSLAITVLEAGIVNATGRLFMDPDGDGSDSDSPGALVGFTVYVDRNRNGVLDENETVAVTDFLGEYELAVPLNTPVDIRPLSLFDWEITLPTPDQAYAINSATTNPIGGLDFGMRFISARWHNSSQPADVNGVGGPTPLDALFIIAELEAADVSDPTDGILQPLANVPDPLFLYDVDNSGFVSPLDALLVVSELPDVVASSPAPLAASSAAAISPATISPATIVMIPRPAVMIQEPLEGDLAPPVTPDTSDVDAGHTIANLAGFDTPSDRPDDGLGNSTSKQVDTEEVELLAELVDQALSSGI